MTLIESREKNGNFSGKKMTTEVAGGNGQNIKVA